MQNSYKNKLFSILGDSVSTLEGYSEPQYAEYYTNQRKLEADIFTPEHTWWGQVIDALDGELLVNNSFYGSMVAKHRDCKIPSYACSSERTSSLSKNGKSPDVIMVLMGINDWGCGASLEPNNETEKDDEAIFSVAYKSMLKKLKANYPSAELWCFTLPVSDYKKAKGESFPYTYAGKHIEEYCKIITACAKEYSCRVIDLYTLAPQFEAMQDGFHPNANGMTAIAQATLRALEKS